MPRRLARIAAVLSVVLSVVLVAGCGGEGAAPSAADGSATRRGVPADDPCRLLDDGSVEALLGTAVAGEARRSAVAEGARTCAYDAPAGGSLQVIRLPADLWARSLPAAVAALRQGPLAREHPELLAKVDEAAALIETGEVIGAEEACGHFSRMLEIQGLPAGRRHIVNLAPSAAAPTTVSGQQCVDGVFSSITVAGADLPAPEIVEDALSRVR